MALNWSKLIYVQFLLNDVSSEIGNKRNVKPVEKHLNEGIDQDFSILSEVILWQNVDADFEAEIGGIDLKGWNAMQVKTQLISTPVCTDRTLLFYASQLAQMHLFAKQSVK